MIDANEAIGLLEKFRSEKQQNDPIQNLSQGLLGGYQQSLAQKQQQKNNMLSMWQDKLKNYDVTKQIQQPDGSMKETLAEPDDLNLLQKHLAETGQWPKGSGFGLKPKILGQMDAKVQLAGAIEEAKRKADISNPLPARPSSKGGINASANLTPEAIDLNAAQYIKTGQLPALGMGGAADKGKILNRAAEMAKAQGLDADAMNYKKSAFKADTGALNQITKQKDMILAFESTADKNLDIAQKLSDKVDRTGIPVVNRYLLAGKKSLTGDVDVAKFDAAIRTAINEYARVTSSVTGGGVTSDSARREVEDLLSKAQTKDQIIGVIQTLKQEMGNRKAGYDEQITDIANRLGGKTTPQPTPNTQPQGQRFQILGVE
jgi:hypothetical protein